jgi:hypothetical protein
VSTNHYFDFWAADKLQHMTNIVSVFVEYAGLVTVAQIFLAPYSIAQTNDSYIRRKSGHDPRAQDLVHIIAAAWWIWLFAVLGVNSDESPIIHAVASYVSVLVVVAGTVTLHCRNRRHQMRM